MKEKETRRSKGVAFILYLSPEDAQKCVNETNEKEVSFLHFQWIYLHTSETQYWTINPLVKRSEYYTDFYYLQFFGRTLKASIAKDNGRAREFIRRKVLNLIWIEVNININTSFQEYPNKTRCYECGEFGHLSYKCDKNLLGERDPPPKKIRKRKKQNPTEVGLSQVIINK